MKRVFPLIELNCASCGKEIKLTFRDGGDTNNSWGDAQAKLKEAVELMALMLPIVDAAYWDQYSAGNFPGAGYHNKPQHAAGIIFDWRSTNKYHQFIARVKEFGLEPPQKQTRP